MSVVFVKFCVTICIEFVASGTIRGEVIKMCDDNITITRFRKLVDKEKSRDSMSKKMAEQGLSCNTSTITKHYNGDRSISTEYVIKYAKYFGVSTDYLLGLSNVSTTETDIRMINEYTGLSELAIDTLNKHNQISKLESDILKNSNTDIMNFLIENIGNTSLLFDDLKLLVNNSFKDISYKFDSKLIEELGDEKYEEIIGLLYRNGAILTGATYRSFLKTDLKDILDSLIDDFCTELNKQSYDRGNYKSLSFYSIESLDKTLELAKGYRKRREEKHKGGDVSNGNNQKEKG